MRFTSTLFLLLSFLSFAHLSTAQTITVSPPELVRSDGTTEQQALFQQDETIRIQWSPQLSSAPNLKIGTSPGTYGLASISVSGTQADIVPNQEGLSTGKYYAVVTNSEGDTFSEIQADADTSSGIEFSQEFRLIIESSSAPTINAPRGTTENTTPTFEWEAISGVPAYWIVVSSTPFEITRNPETDEIEVQGANVVWQVITTNTSIQYGTTNPADAFPDIQPPSLESGKEYNYTVLNVFSEENLALASDVFGSVVPFSLSDDGESLPPPSLSAPQDSTTIYGDETITFDWDPVEAANDYSVYVFERTTEGGSEVELPIWNTSTTNTLVDFPAATNLKRGTYVWYVVPNDETGAGNQSETRLFNYEVPMGEFRFRTRSAQTGNDVVGATVTARSLDGGYTPRNPYIARGTATLTDSLVAGPYEFQASLTGYADTTVTVEIAAATQTSFDINMRPLPSQILGSVVDEDGAAVQGAEVSLTNSSTGATKTTTTNASGNFNIGLPPGTYDIQAGGSGLISSPVRTVSVGPDEQLTLDAPLSVQIDEVPVSGSVVNQQGQGIQLADVVATSSDGATQQVSTDGSGAYSLVLSSGEWTLEANKSGFVGSDPRTLSLSAGDNLQNEDFTLSPRANQISGTVFEVVTLPSGDTDLAPFEGATVTATPLSGSPKTTTTLSNGQYSLDLGSGTYTIEASAENYNSSQNFEVTVDVGETRDGFDFELTPHSAEINGQVTLSDGTPIEGATVSIENIGSTQTLSNGAYTLTVPPGSYEVSVSKSGFIAPDPNSVSVGPDGVVTGISFTMTPNAGTISGTVNSDGEPVTNATVTASQDGETVTATTTNLGEYSLSVSPGTWTIGADKSGFAPSDSISITVAAGQQSTGNAINLEQRIAQIGGTVTDGSAPIRNASITVSSLTDSSASPIQTQSGTDGGFTVSVESGEQYEILAQKNGFRSDADTTDVLAPETSTNFPLALTPTSSSVEGTVETTGGESLSGAIVRALQDGSTVDSTSTATDGSYSLSLDSGTYTLEADLGGYTKSSRQATLEPGENATGFDFSLPENFSTLRGTITDDSSNAVVDALVSLSGPTSSSVRSLSDGSYVVTSLAAGSYVINVQKTGFESKEISLTLGEGTTTTRDVTLPRQRGQISGQISTRDGTELEGATVTATTTDQSFSSVSTSDGSYQISALPVGDYTVTASLAGYSSDTTASVTLSQDNSEATANISDFTVNRASLTGIVRDSTSGSPLLNATVQLSGNAGTGSDATNTEGQYTVDALAPGTYTVTVQKDGFGGPTRQVQLSNGESDTLDLAMGPNVGEISGTVIGSDGEPLDFSTTVKATSGNLQFTATTDSEGAFSLTELENGRTYTVATKIFREGYSNVSTTVDLPAGSSSAGPVELTVPKRTASISGSVGTPDASLELKNQETNEVARVTQSQSDAVYQFTFLPAGNYTVVPSKAGYVFSPDSQTVSLSADQAETVDFQATSATGTITASVSIDADRSAEGVQITAASSDNTVTRRLATSQAGRVTFQELPASKTYVVQASLDGFTSDPSSRQVSLAPADSASTSFTLIPNRSAIEGLVTDTDGNAIRSASISARNLSDGSISSTQTDNQGRYSITDLRSGSYEVIAAKSGFISDTLQVSLDNGETLQDIDFALTPANVRIEGVVRQADGFVEGVTVMANGRSSLSTTTDAQGRFAFPQAPIRIGASDTTTYAITISGANFTTQRRVLDIPASQAGETIRLDDFLLPSGQINLTVTDGVSPLPGVSVTLTQPGGQSLKQVTGADGQIVSGDRLQAGTYQASVSKGGYLTPTSASLQYELPTDTSQLETTLLLPYQHTPPDSVKANEDTNFQVRFRQGVSPTDVSATLYYKKTTSQNFKSVSMTRSDTSFAGVLPAQFSLTKLDYYVEVVDQESGITYTSSERTIEPLAAGILTAARIVPSVNNSRLRVGDTYDLDVRLQDGLSQSLEDEFVGANAVGRVTWTLSDPSAGTIEFPDEQDSTHVTMTFDQAGQYRLDIQARLRGSLVNRSATVQVAKTAVENISVSTPTNRLSNESGGAQMSVSAVDTSGASVLLGENLSWSVTPESAASISESGFLSPADSTFIGPVTVVAQDAKSEIRNQLTVQMYASINGQTQATLQGANGATFTIPAGAVTFPAQIGLTSGTQGPTKKQVRPIGSDQLYKVAENIRKFTFRADRSLPGDSLREDATLSFKSPQSLRLHEGEQKVGRYDKTEAQWRTKSTEKSGGRLVANSVRNFGEYAVMVQNTPLDLREVAVLPNPFSPEVAPLKIGYFLDTNDPPAEVTIRIFNARGELVRTLLNDDLQPPGRYGSRTGVKQITWDGQTDGGLQARNGRYIVQIKARDQTGVVTERIPVVLVK